MEPEAAWSDVDLYATLGVAADASEAEITAAYRRLARALHPDTSRDPAAEERFKAVATAYEVLRHADRRAGYDRARRSARGGRRRPGGGYSVRVRHLDDSGRPAGDDGRAGAPTDPVFGRRGDDLTITVPISYREAVLGADVTVPTVGDAPVTVRIPPGTPSGQVLRVRGRGVPSAHGRGDLLVTVQVQVPTRLDDRQRELIHELGRYDDPDRRAHLERRRPR